jgi:hypothetical protein
LYNTGADKDIVAYYSREKYYIFSFDESKPAGVARLGAEERRGATASLDAGEARRRP